MWTMHRTAVAFISLALLAGPSSQAAPLSVNEDPQPDSAGNSSKVAADSGSHSEAVYLNVVDQKLALNLAVDANTQIAFAEFALSKVDKDAVRNYAKSQLAKQRALAAKMDSLTSGEASTLILQATRQIEADKAKPQLVLSSVRSASSIQTGRSDSVVDRADEERAADSETVTRGARKGHFGIRSNSIAMVVRIKLEMGQEYMDSLQTDLVSNHDCGIDLRYLTIDTLNQMQTLATLKVFEGQASPEFAKVIHQARSQAAQQLELGKELLSTLESGHHALSKLDSCGSHIGDN